tara:strand:- start:861 stop:3086 length:2226 start_codon:yes stop_codon:yes gene_type:complete
MKIQLDTVDPDGNARNFADGKIAIVHSDQIENNLMLYDLENLNTPKTTIKCTRSEEHMEVVYMTFYIRGNETEMNKKTKKITTMSPQMSFFFEPADIANIENMDEGIKVSDGNFTLRICRSDLKNPTFKKHETYPKCITECSKTLQVDQFNRTLLLTMSMDKIIENKSALGQISAANMRMPLLLTPFYVDVYQHKVLCAANSTMNNSHNFNRLIAAVVQAFIQHTTEVGIFYEKCGATCADDVVKQSDATKEEIFLHMEEYLDYLLNMKQRVRDIESDSASLGVSENGDYLSDTDFVKTLTPSINHEWMHLKDKIFEAFEYISNHINSEYAYDSGLGFQRTPDCGWNCVRTKNGETQNLSGIPLRATVQVRKEEFASRLKSGDKSLECVSEYIDIDDCEGLAAKNTSLLDMLHELPLGTIYTMVDRTLKMPEHVHHLKFRALILKCLEQLKMDQKNVSLGLVFAGSAHAGNANAEVDARDHGSGVSSNLDAKQYENVMQLLNEGSMAGHAVPVFHDIDESKSVTVDALTLKYVEDFKFYEATGMVVQCDEDLKVAQKKQITDIYKYLSDSTRLVKVCMPKKSKDIQSWYQYSIAMGSLSVETDTLLDPQTDLKAKIEPFSLLKNHSHTNHYLIDMKISNKAESTIRKILETMRHSYCIDNDSWREFQRRTNFTWGAWYERIPPVLVKAGKTGMYLEIIPIRIVLSNDKNNSRMRQACAKYKSISYQKINNHCSILYINTDK